MEKAQLRWRCRRGMKELDVLLERYLARRYDAAPDAERSTFIELLECEDPQIWGWIMGFEEPPCALFALVKELQRFR